MNWHKINWILTLCYRLPFFLQYLEFRNKIIYLLVCKVSSQLLPSTVTVGKFSLTELRKALKKSQDGCGKLAPQPHLHPLCREGGRRDVQGGGSGETHRGGRRIARGVFYAKMWLTDSLTDSQKDAHIEVVSTWKLRDVLQEHEGATFLQVLNNFKWFWSM